MLGRACSLPCGSDFCSGIPLLHPCYRGFRGNTVQYTLPESDFDQLNRTKARPGRMDAASDTLHKPWRAGLDLQSRVSDHPRLKSLAKLEETVLMSLPPMTSPPDLVRLAQGRLIAHRRYSAPS